MKLNISLLSLLFVLTATTMSYAQVFKKLQKKLENHAEGKVDEILNGKNKNQNPGPGQNPENSSPLPIPTELVGEPFRAGTSLIFEDDINLEQPGHMASNWQTNSTGNVVSVPGAPGQWLQLAKGASYQLDSLLMLPGKFTVEFDLLTRSQTAQDLRDITFGFSKTNSTRNYIYGVANETNVATKLMFYYESVRTKSNNNGNESRLEYPLSNYANAIIHVGIEVNDQHMKVFLDDAKILDALIFNPRVPKHFFISTDNSSRNNASVYLSNFNIKGF